MFGDLCLSLWLFGAGCLVLCANQTTNERRWRERVNFAALRGAFWTRVQLVSLALLSLPFCRQVGVTPLFGWSKWSLDFPTGRSLARSTLGRLCEVAAQNLPHHQTCKPLPRLWCPHIACSGLDLHWVGQSERLGRSVFSSRHHHYTTVAAPKRANFTRGRRWQKLNLKLATMNIGRPVGRQLETRLARSLLLEVTPTGRLQTKGTLAKRRARFSWPWVA